MEERKEDDLELNLNYEEENFQLTSSSHEYVGNSENLKTYSSNFKLNGLSFQQNKNHLRLALTRHIKY